jgi:hypothetical protein
MDYPKLRLVTTDEVQEREIPSFGRWLVGLARDIKAAPGTLALLTSSAAASLYGAISRADHLADPKYLLPITSGAQCLIILFFIFLSRLTPVRGFSARADAVQADECLTAEEGCAVCAHVAPEYLGHVKEMATRAMRHYRNYWMILWLCWFLLYAALTFVHIVDDEKIRVALKVGATLLNNSAAFALLYCYLTLSRPESLGINSEKGEGQTDWYVWVATLATLTVVEATLVTLAMAGKLPARFAPASADGIAYAKAISNCFGWISGIGSTVVMSFYTRRLASRFMDCPTWVIVLLYVYAALQPGFGVIGPDNPKETVLLLDFALVLKTVLFFYMTWVFKYGWLLYYFSQVARFKESPRDKMKEFSQHLD